MKFLHLSDLHLGKQMNDVSLLADQEAVLLGQVVPIARRENVDAVLIAGDVYQRATPQAEAVALFDRFVSELAAMGRRGFIISGNHDSAQRISYFSALVRSAGGDRADSHRRGARADGRAVAGAGRRAV